MVRGRRTRRAAASVTTTTTTTTTPSLSPIANGRVNNSSSTSPLAQQNGVKLVAAAKGNVVLVEDFCCASPKRKEYKIDELLTQKSATSNGGYTLGCGGDDDLTMSPTKTRMVLRGTQNSQSSSGITNNGTGSERGSTTTITTNGRLCPVAGNEITRFLLSQSKSKSRKARKKSPNFELVNDDTCDSFTHATTLQEQQQQSNGTTMGVVKMEADEEEVVEVNGGENQHPFQMFGRMPIGSGMVAAENIFLQEPVLKLTVDEAARVLVQPKSEEEEEQQRLKEAPAAVAFINQDSNSGDSGVVIDKQLEQQQQAAQNSSVTPKPLLNVSRPRVPTTPHRILCPSSEQQVVGNGSAGVKEETNGVGEEAEGEDDGQVMTKRKLILPTKGADDEVEEELKPESEAKPASVKVEEAMKAPKANGMAKGTAAQSHHHQATMEDFFKVRRSVRKTKKEVEREEQLAIEKAILSACDIGLAVKMFDNKGRGIVATRPFARGEFVVEYVGEFISIAEANRREKVYAQDQSTGCYMYYFKHKNKQYCIDATEETGKLGRLVNHSRNGNLMTRTVEVKGQPHLVLIAKEDIEEGRELNYDYGDRSKEALLHHPWLAY